jgi:hypothetical protein
MEKKRIKVKLIGKEGNSFFIMGTVNKALKKAGMKEEAKLYLKEATQGDYDHLLMVTQKYVDIY